MKKLNITFLLTTLLSLVGARALAHDIEVKNADGVTIYYNWANNKTELSVSYRGSYASNYSGNVVIPESVTYDGTTYPVTSIGWSAFSGCSGLTNITIPNSVTSIDANAFNGCSSLASVIIPNSVTSIGGSVFSGCSNLESVTIGIGVLSIGSFVFSGHQPAKVIWLTNTPPSGYSSAAGTVNYVANDLYTSLSNKTVYPFLSSIFEVDGVKYVPVSPSERTCDAIDCTYDSNAENINIGKTVSYKGIEMAVKRVHKYACYNNNFIKNVELSLNGDVEGYAFYRCNNISQVTAVNGGNIGASVFEAITSEFVANINNNGSIGQKAFYQSTGLKTLEIGGNVTNFGSKAFYGCTNLTTAQIQNKGNTWRKCFLWLHSNDYRHTGRSRDGNRLLCI